MIVQKQVLHLTADIGYHLFCFFYAALQITRVYALDRELGNTAVTTVFTVEKWIGG